MSKSNRRRAKPSTRTPRVFDNRPQAGHGASRVAEGRSDDADARPILGDASVAGVRARVRNGRLIVDSPTTLPEGTVLDLVVDDEGDDLDPAERAARDAALLRAWEEARAGEGMPAAKVLDRLRRR